MIAIPLITVFNVVLGTIIFLICLSVLGICVALSVGHVGEW
jgi:hypothetical protein